MVLEPFTGTFSVVMGERVNVINRTLKRNEEPAQTSCAVPDQDTVTSQVLLLARSLQADFLQQIRETGLTPAQANTLRELSIAPVLSQHELARRLRIGKPAVGEALHKLEKAGLVHRERASDNRRLVTVRLTTRGEHALHLIARAAQDQIAFLTERLGSEDVECLNRLLIKANEVLYCERLVTKVR